MVETDRIALAQGVKQGWETSNLRDYPMCLFRVRIFTRRISTRATVEYEVLPPRTPPLPPPFDNLSQEDLKALTPEKRLLLQMEAKLSRYQAELAHFKAMEERLVRPYPGQEQVLEWVPFIYRRSTPQGDSFNKDGDFTLLCRPEQVTSLLSSPEPGLVLLQELKLESSGPLGPFYSRVERRVAAIRTPFFQPRALHPCKQAPVFPLKAANRTAIDLNKNVQENGLWTLAEVTKGRPYDLVADGL
jgi:hypothetical protein